MIAETQQPASQLNNNPEKASVGKEELPDLTALGSGSRGFSWNNQQRHNT